MRQLILGCLLVGGGLVASARPSHADVTQVNGFCFASPDNRLIPCTSPTPTPGPAPIQIVKSLAVSSGVPGPAHTTAYKVTVTSQLGCFTLDEPTTLYALGSSSAAALNELSPVSKGSSGSMLSVSFGQGNGANPDGVSTVSLEVANDHIGPEGLDLKAVWPAENVERVVNVIPAAATATSGPGTPTATATAIPASTATSAPTGTGTPLPSPTPVPPTGPVRVQTCVDPQVLSGQGLGGDSPVIRGLSSPGAICTSNVIYLDGTRPNNFDGTARTADSQGLVAFSLAENTSAGGGFARVQCAATSGGQAATACTGFLIRQPSDVGLIDADVQALVASIQGMVRDPAACNTYFGS